MGTATGQPTAPNRAVVRTGTTRRCEHVLAGPEGESQAPTADAFNCGQAVGASRPGPKPSPTERSPSNGGAVAQRPFGPNGAGDFDHGGQGNRHRGGPQPVGADC